MFLSTRLYRHYSGGRRDVFYCFLICLFIFFFKFGLAWLDFDLSYEPITFTSGLTFAIEAN